MYAEYLNDIPIPPRVRQLRIDTVRRVPVPWFVADDAPSPDFRYVTAEKLSLAIRRKLCWICGQRLDPTFAFVLGPMCMVNRVNAEPPNHLDCARFAAMACPFLTKPRMRRNEKYVPDEAHDMPGMAIKRNPGCCVVWLTNGYSLFDAGNGQLFEIGKPLAIEFYAEGRKATREEVLESIRTGLPILREVAEQDGREAVAELEQMAARAVALVPA